MDIPVKKPKVDENVLEAWNAQLVEVANNPFLANMIVQRGDKVLPRFEHFYRQLRASPRRARRALQRKLAVTLAGAALLLALSGTPVKAADINVTGGCTLVDAITAADTDTPVGGCSAGSGADSIVLQPGSTHTLNSVNNNNHYIPTGLPVVSSEITIEGNNATIQRDSGAPDFSILNVADSGDLTLNDVKINSGNEGYSVIIGGDCYPENNNVVINNSTISGVQNGQSCTLQSNTLEINNSTITGAGVHNSFSELDVNNSTISGVDNQDGPLSIENSIVDGVSNYEGEVIINNSTISGVDSGDGTMDINNTTISGSTFSGVFLYQGATATINNSTISGNTASSNWNNHGGGVYLTQSSLTLNNSTISGNTADRGGGLYAYYSNVTINNSTITGNTSSNKGGGVFNSYSGVYFNQSIISGNAAPNGREIYSRGYDDIGGNNYNIFGFDNDAGGKFYYYGVAYDIEPGPTDIVPGAGVQVSDILISTLADNGGNTETHALVPSSPALDAIPSALCSATTDQRGISRPQSADCDIGAFELELVQNHPPIPNAGPNLNIASENQNTTTIQGTATDADPNDVLEYQWKEGATVLLELTSVGPNGECPLNLSTVSLGIGTHALTLEVTDGKDTLTDELILTIENSAPHAAPTGGGVYEIFTDVVLSGEVSDFDGDTLTYEWSEGTTALFSGTVDTIHEGYPVVLPEHIISDLSLGLHTLTLTVIDGANESVLSNITVEIVDSTVPTLAPVPNKTILWPPNHKMVDIFIEVNAADNSGGTVTLSATVSSNEPEDGLGDGDTAPDWSDLLIDQELGIITLKLRAERSGSGESRVYTIPITATDEAGNSSSADVEIIVPHDKGKK